MSTTRWTHIAEAAELSVERPRVIKTGGKQIALFRLESGEIHAIDNRCPHQGYPLSTGLLRDGVVTCEWHNWKFRLCDGACILGGEDVRRYPLRVEDGAILIDLADPPPAQAVAPLHASLAAAFDEGDWTWAARLVQRLLAAGQRPEEIVAVGGRYAAARAPYGFDHGLAAAADLAAVLGEVSEPDVVVVEALSLMVEPNLRRGERPVAAPEPVEPSALRDGRRVELELRRRIEAEDLPGAEALVRGALAAGAGAEVLGWLAHAATDHFLDYAHGHIYCVKAEELLERIGWEHADWVLSSLVATIVYGTREDRLPYLREYARLMAPRLEQLAPWADAAGEPGRLDVDALVSAVVDGALGEALAAVAAALDARVAPARIALALAVAASHRLLRFDERLEHDDDTNEGWLHITHALTHADAVRETLARRPSADSLRGLFHSARFVQHLHVCDRPESERPAVAEGAPDPQSPDRGLAQALARGDAAAAMAAARAAMREHTGVPAAVRQALVGAMLADRVAVPIFLAHHIKMTLAALRLAAAAAADPDLAAHAHLPLVAAARFLAHPLKERRVARGTRVARAFVREGRQQKRLLGY